MIRYIAGAPAPPGCGVEGLRLLQEHHCHPRHLRQLVKPETDYHKGHQHSDPADSVKYRV